MRFGFASIPHIYKLRKRGNDRAFILIDLRAFSRGFNLFAPFYSAGMNAKPKPFFVVERWRVR